MELDRDDVLATLGLLERGQLPEFDRLTRIASRVMHAPVTLVSFVASDQQIFKGREGELPARFADGTPLSHSFCQHVVSSGEPLVVEDALAHPLVRDNLAVADLNVLAYAGWPVVDPAGNVLGSLCAIDSTTRAWSPEELALLADLADLASDEVALRAANRHAERALARERATSAMLQHALRPQIRLHAVSGQIGGHYQPAAGIIGGDVVDAFEFGHASIGLVVSDIVGKGPVAATSALELRGETRRLAITDPRPAAVLTGLDEVAQTNPGLFGASMLYGTVDVDQARFTWISAGHPAPIVRSDREAWELPTTGGILIGLRRGERPWIEREVQLAPGDTIVLYTDGLLEIPSTDMGGQVARLIDLVASGPEDPQGLCDAIASEFAHDQRRDDVAVLAFTLGS
jgi:serine phosphatase RsbU (regulator of sigma subunit)